MNTSSYRNDTFHERNKTIYCIKGFSACLIMLLNAVKLICIKRMHTTKSLRPYTMFMISFSLSDLCLGSMTLLVTWTGYLTTSFNTADSTLIHVNGFAKCCLFASFTISFIHLNVFELVRMKVVSKPFLRQRVTNTVVLKFIMASWMIALLVASSAHFIMKIVSSTLQVEEYENIFLSVLALVTFPMLYFCMRKIREIIRNRKLSQIELLGYSLRKHRSNRRIVVGDPRPFPKIKKITGTAPMVVFSVCWAPFILCTIFNFLGVWEKIVSKSTNRTIHSIVCVIPYLNYTWISAVYIYTMVSFRSYWTAKIAILSIIFQKKLALCKLDT